MQEKVCMYIGRYMLDGRYMHLHSFIWSFFTLDSTNVFKGRAPLLPMLVKTCLSAGWGRNIRVGRSGVEWGGVGWMYTCSIDENPLQEKGHKWHLMPQRRQQRVNQAQLSGEAKTSCKSLTSMETAVPVSACTDSLQQSEGKTRTRLKLRAASS